jgi:hypothetical protein
MKVWTALNGFSVIRTWLLGSGLTTSSSLCMLSQGKRFQSMSASSWDRSSAGQPIQLSPILLKVLHAVKTATDSIS